MPLNQDGLFKFMTQDGKFRGAVTVVTDVLREIARNHDLFPTAAVALGRALAGGALMAGLLKEDQSLAIKFEGPGPLRKILVEASHDDGALRGAVGNPHVDTRTPDGRFDVAGALGLPGLLTVSKDLGLRTPYVGTVPLASGEIGEDLAFYLADSEQIPSAVSLGAALSPDGIVAAGGFILQAMPPVDEALVEEFMERLAKLPGAAALLQQASQMEDVARAVLGTHPFETLERRELHFACTCSREKIVRALRTLSRDDLMQMAESKEETRVTCEFCLKQYAFAPEEMQAIAAERNAAGPA